MNRQILIVDDEAPMRELLSRYLGKRGFDVTTASSSKEALDLLNNTQFDLAILDANPKNEYGLDLLHAVKRKQAEVPVIMFTGNLDGDLPAKALSAGANGLVYKTSSLHDLFIEVCRHISG